MPSRSHRGGVLAPVRLLLRHRFDRRGALRVTFPIARDCALDGRANPTLTVAQVSRRIHVHPNTLSRWLSSIRARLTLSTRRTGVPRFAPGEKSRILSDNNATVPVVGRQLFVRGLEPKLVWLAHEAKLWRPPAR